MSHEPPPLNGNGKGWNWSQISFFAGSIAAVLALVAFGYQELKGLVNDNQSEIKAQVIHEVERNDDIEDDASKTREALAELRGRVDTFRELYLAGKLKGTE